MIKNRRFPGVPTNSDRHPGFPSPCGIQHRDLHSFLRKYEAIARFQGSKVFKRFRNSLFVFGFDKPNLLKN